MGIQRITSKVSNSGIFTTSPVNTTDLQAKLTAQTTKIKERFDSLGVKYSGVQQTGGLVSLTPPSGGWGAEDKYFYHPVPTAGAAIKMGASSTTWDRNMHLGFIDGNRAFTSVMSLIHEKGFVGIGTTIPDEMLTVKGKIHAREVIVDLNGPLADYVFSPDYSLMPLPKVEAFVKQNKHLPEIPSAAEVKEKGLSMGEMQNKLLQKIEELTLYVIEQQKQIEELKAQIVK